MNQFRIIIEYEIILKLARESCHGRGLSKIIGVPLTNIQRFLKYLESLGVITFSRIGRNKTYFLKDNLRTKQMLIAAECYKLHKLFVYYPKLTYIIEEMYKFSGELIILFGSYAKFSAKSDSDIDIYVDTRNKDMEKEIELINSRVNVKIGKFNANDLLIREIMKNHVIIHGHEKYYDMVFKKNGRKRSYRISREK